MLEFGCLYFISKLQELLSNVFFARPQWLSRPSNATKYAPLLLALGRSSVSQVNSKSEEQNFRIQQPSASPSVGKKTLIFLEYRSHFFKGCWKYWKNPFICILWEHVFTSDKLLQSPSRPKTPPVHPLSCHPNAQNLGGSGKMPAAKTKKWVRTRGGN